MIRDPFHYGHQRPNAYVSVLKHYYILRIYYALKHAKLSAYKNDKLLYTKLTYFL